MNPLHLYSITSGQKKRYSEQPDLFTANDQNTRYIENEFESPHYVAKSTMRFWYNTESTNYDTHWHKAYELIIPLEESYTVTISSKEWYLNQGDIFLIPPGELHMLSAPPTGARFIFLFEPNFFREITSFAQVRSFFSEPILILWDRNPALYEKEIALIHQLADYYWSDNIVREMHLYSCLLNLFSNIAEEKENASPFTAPNSFAEASTEKEQTAHRLNTVLKFMEEHYADRLTLDEIAAQSGFSKFYFSKIFRQYTGKTFYNYLSMLRIQASQELLADNETPVSNIAVKCGFTSLSSFNRTFHQINGCTPTDYRKSLS